MTTNSTLPPRPRWRSLALLALCLAPLLWPLEHLAERYYRNELVSQNRQTLDLYVANLLGTLHRYETLPQILSQLPDLPAALKAPQGSAPQEAANHLLQTIVRQTGAEVMYLMNADVRRLLRRTGTSATALWAAILHFVLTSATPWPVISGVFSAWARRLPSVATSSPQQYVTTAR